MADRYWVNDDADGLWNKANNWATSSGGAGGAGVPGASDHARFDSAENSDCRLDAAISVSAITISGYTGTVDGATDDLNHSVSGTLGHFAASATIDLGAGTWSVGNWDQSQGTTVESGNTITVAGYITIGSLVTITKTASTDWILTATANLQIEQEVTEVSLDSAVTTTCIGSLKCETLGQTNGTLDGNDKNITVSGDCTLAGTQVDMGSGNWEIGGDLTYSGVGTLNRETSTVILTGSSKTFAPSTLYTKRLYNLTVSGSYSCSSNFTWSGTFTVNGSFTQSSGIAAGDGNFTLGAAGTITGAGTLRVNSALTHSGGTYSIANTSVTRANGTSSMTAGTYTTDMTIGQSTGGANNHVHEFGAGTVTINGDVAFECTGTATLTIDFNTNDPDVNISGDVSTVNSGGGTHNIDCGTGTWTCSGNWDSTNTTSTVLNQATFVFDGTSKTLNWISGWADRFGAIQVDGTITVDTSGGTTTGFTITAGSTFTCDDSVFFDQSLAIPATATITGTAALSCRDGITDISGTLSPSGGFAITGDSTDAAGTYDCDMTWRMASNGASHTHTLGAGTFTINGNMTLSGNYATGDVTLDCNTNDPDVVVNGDFTGSTGGATTDWQMGSGSWTVSGDLDVTAIDVGGNSSTLVMTGTSKSLTNTGYSNRFSMVHVSGTISADIDCDKIRVLAGGTLTMSANCSAYSGDTDNVIIEATGTLNDSGDRQLQFRGGIDNSAGGTVSVYKLYNDGTTSGPAMNGTFTVRDEFSVRRDGAFSFKLNGDSVVNGRLEVWHNNQPGSSFNMQNFNLTVTGTLEFDTAAITNGGTINLTGSSGTQAIDFGGASGGDLVINCPGATKQFTGTAAPASLTHTAGTFDPNGQTFNITNDWTQASGQDPDLTGLAGSTFNVGGNLSWPADASNVKDIQPGSVWYLNVTGTANVSWCEFANTDASGGVTVQAATSYDAGSPPNVNINFTDPELGQHFLNGDIAEIIVYSGALSTEDRQKVEGYLATKWGLSLPGGHPYA